MARKEGREKWGRRKKIALILPPQSFVSEVLPSPSLILSSGGWYNNNNNNNNGNDNNNNNKTGSEIVTAQDQALQTKYYATKILNTETDNKCRLCQQFDETIDHIIPACPIRPMPKRTVHKKT